MRPPFVSEVEHRVSISDISFGTLGSKEASFIIGGLLRFDAAILI